MDNGSWTFTGCCVWCLVDSLVVQASSRQDRVIDVGRSPGDGPQADVRTLPDCTGLVRYCAVLCLIIARRAKGSMSVRMRMKL